MRVIPEPKTPLQTTLFIVVMGMKTLKRNGNGAVTLKMSMGMGTSLRIAITSPIPTLSHTQIFFGGKISC